MIKLKLESIRSFHTEHIISIYPLYMEFKYEINSTRTKLERSSICVINTSNNILLVDLIEGNIITCVNNKEIEYKGIEYRSIDYIQISINSNKCCLEFMYSPPYILGSSVCISWKDINLTNELKESLDSIVLRDFGESYLLNIDVVE